MGVVATDGAGRVLFSNTQAEAMLKASNRVVIRDGRLSAVDTTLDDQLRKALEAAARSASSTSLPVPARTPNGEDLLMTVAPLGDTSPMWSVLSRPSVLLLIRSRSRLRVLTAAQLIQLFRFTPAEARVARALAQGESLEDYAIDAGITLATVRTQLRSVLNKTGTHRQTDLVRLLVSIMSVRS